MAPIIDFSLIPSRFPFRLNTWLLLVNSDFSSKIISCSQRNVGAECSYNACDTLAFKFLNTLLGPIYVNNMKQTVEVLCICTF